MAVPMTGSDVESALELIESNGGIGAFELPEERETVQRWLFPRFPGATDDADMYLSRVGIGPNDTDVETIVSWMRVPRNVVGAVLLLSPPGTGKTALIEAARTHACESCKKHRKTGFDVECAESGGGCKVQEMTTVLCTPDHTQSSLFKVFVGEGKGDCINHGHVDSPLGSHVDTCEGGCTRSPFTLGPIPYAAKHGHWLYLDEVMRLDDGVVPILYPLADGRHILPEGNVDGSDMVIAPGFRLILSSNPLVRGASLPEPIASRCAGTTMHVETDAALLYDLGIDESIIGAWETMRAAGGFFPQIRELRVANYWLPIDETQAASALVPEHCPESEREAIRNTAVTYLGGDLGLDGRLVVK